MSVSGAIGSVTAATKLAPSTAAASVLFMRVVATAESLGSTESGTGVVACGSIRSIGSVRSLNVSALS